MDNLIFSLNASMPVFLTMILGYFFMKIGLFNKNLSDMLNNFVFKAALPALLFKDLATVDFIAVWDTKYVLFCFLSTALSILAVFLLSFLLKDRGSRAEFIQGSYRSSSALLGIAFVTNIYGSSGMAPLMIVATVPLYNIVAVIVLSLLKPEKEAFNKALLFKTLKGIVTNPIILGIVFGMIWSLLRLPLPEIASKTVGNLACLATPLGLMSMGASFEFKAARSQLAPAIAATVIKLVALPAVFVPIAAFMGFKDEKMVAILVMLGASTTVATYIMARSMGHKGVLSSNIVMLTTLFSAFTLTFWLFLLRTLGLI